MENLDTKESMLQSVRAMENKLSELNQKMEGIAAKTDVETHKKIEHFQNQFIVQEKQLDKMKHNIKIYGSSDKGQTELKEYTTYFGTIVDEFKSFVSEHQN